MQLSLLAGLEIEIELLKKVAVSILIRPDHYREF